MSSFWKSRLCLSIFGQSHGEAIGMTLDGIPAGHAIDMEELQTFMRRRAPGHVPWSTARLEEDVPEFISGLVNGLTCGAPITALIRNNNVRSFDYTNIMNIPRPSHADYTAHVKHGGFQDVAGGGHFSGRLTAALCIAGGICLQLLKKRGIFIGAFICSIGTVSDLSYLSMNIDAQKLTELTNMVFPAFSNESALSMQAEIDKTKQAGDSVGGIIGCIAIGVPAGLGEPMFDCMESHIARLVFAIPAVKGIEFGAGFEAAAMHGSDFNDPFYWDGKTVKTRTNNNGGILGGITSGMPLLFRAAVKPTPSIEREQESINLSTKESAALKIQGRHDPCIVPRAVPCLEAAAAIAIYDTILEQEGAKLK